MECLEPVYVESGQVPCGKCAVCCRSRRNDWMFRIRQEMRVQEHRGYFVTLTYDEKSVKRIDGQRSLRFRDVQLLFKRMRKDGWYVKYVAVGEYGSRTERPHYHVLLWTDLDASRIEDYWYRLWFGKVKRRLGHVHVGELNEKSAAYALKYIIERQVLPDGDLRERPRAQFSKGIGVGYFSWKMYDYHVEGNNFQAVLDGHIVALPRYYRKKFFSKHQRKEERIRLQEERKKERQARLDKVPKRVQDPVEYLAALDGERAARWRRKSKHENLNEL